MGASNHPEWIDEAFLRRMEGRHLLLLPEKEEKMKLLNYTLRGDSRGNSPIVEEVSSILF